MKRGFTMMEVLVSVGVLGLMAALLLGIVSSMFAIDSDVDDLVEVHHMARVSMERMTRDLSQAFLSVNQGPEETTKTVFLGERDRVVFCYVGNIPTRAGGLETDQGVLEYRLGGRSKGRSGKKLIRRFKPTIDDDPENGGEEAVLAEGVKTLRFEYYSKEDEDWDSDWKADDPLSIHEPGFKLPPRVRIVLEFYDNRDQVHYFETQTALYMLNPLLFGKATSKKGIGHEVKKAQEKTKKQIKTMTGMGGR